MMEALNSPKPFVETSAIRLELSPEGILICYYKPRQFLTLDQAREIVRARLEFVGRTPRPVLIYNLGAIGIDKQARRYMSSNADALSGVSAAATITESYFTHYVMELIYKIERPPLPARNFLSAQRAMAWLKTFL
jgi:hypothetical protein